MMWLVVLAGIYLGRHKIAKLLTPYLGEPKKTSFYGHTVTLGTAAIFILPVEFVGLSAMKRPAYMMCLWSVVLNCIFIITTNNPAPPLAANVSFSNWRESFQQAQPWLQKVMLSIDFHFLFFAAIFLMATPSMLGAIALLILGRRSFWAVCTYAAANMPESALWKRVLPLWTICKGKEEQVLRSCALGEIVLGFLLALRLFPPSMQSLMQAPLCMFYWHFLKIRYQVPRSQKQHLPAWNLLGEKVAPLVKAVPLLSKPIDMGKKWFRPQYG